MSIKPPGGYKIDLFTSPHVQNYSERFIFESKEISEESLFNLLSEVGSVNGNNIAQLKDINNLDGFLVGGASQNSKKFIDIIKKTFN